MLTAIIIAILIAAFLLVWYSLLYLLRHPDIDFNLDSEVLAHEPGLEEKVYKIRTYLHNEETASVDELSALLGVSYEEALRIVNLLEKNNLVSIVDDNGELIVQQIWE